MNEPDKDFKALRTLVSLKRHEVPPPGFFNDFSKDIVMRIRRGDTDNPDPLGTKIHSAAPWLLRLIQNFQAKPAYAGIFASVLGLLLVGGIVYTDNPGSTPEDLMPPQTAEISASLTAAAMTSPTIMDQAGLASQPSLSSTNPVLNLEPGASAFGGPAAGFQSPVNPQYPQ